MASILVPKTAGGRPPSNGGPTRTTFAGDPDDGRQDMLVVIKDQVERLIRESKYTQGPDRIREIMQWIDLLELREKWLLGEIATERLVDEPPAAPLGIEEDPFDLSSLRTEFESPRSWQYNRLLGLVREAKWMLLDQLGDPISDERAS